MVLVEILKVLSGGSDVMLYSRGGITLYCNGTSWFALDK